MSPGTELPSIAEVLGGVLRRVPRAQQPLLIALAERLAAERYRGWADEVGDADRRSGLLACADREDQIASRVEALYPAAAAIQRDILEKNPDLIEVNRSLFAGRPLDEQFLLQVGGERLGAATWRSFARAEENAEARRAFLECALLEEESAAFLERA
jgi:hypothetical protein